MTSLGCALDALRGLRDDARAARMAAYHKVPRAYLGVQVPEIAALVAAWRAGATVEARVALAAGLWDSDIHEARVAAAKLLTQARLRPDENAWALIASWVPQFDGWALADHACAAGSRRLVADPARLDQVEVWTRAPSLWVRRAALVMTLPWAKFSHPKPDDLARRDRILGWVAGYVSDRDRFIQKAAGWWLRDLSRHDPDRVRAFLAEQGAAMRPLARREAARHLSA